jgi:dihydrofolate reductase
MPWTRPPKKKKIPMRMSHMMDKENCFFLLLLPFFSLSLTNKMKFSVILAVSQACGSIGHAGDLPWPHLEEDMRFFRDVTTGPSADNAVIMGRKTWDSIAEKYRPLKKRTNVVITSSQEIKYPVITAVGLSDALVKVASIKNFVGEVFVIGGAGVYTEALIHPDCENIYITWIMSGPDGAESAYEKSDTKVPAHLLPPTGFVEKHDTVVKVDPKTGIMYKFSCYERKVTEEAEPDFSVVEGDEEHPLQEYGPAIQTTQGEVGSSSSSEDIVVENIVVETDDGNNSPTEILADEVHDVVVTENSSP